MAKQGAMAVRLPASHAGRTIERAVTGVTAFLGRALKGPLNQPVRIESFTEFERTFGGLWQLSTLSYAVEQFFCSGGQRAIVVRVANGARAPTLTLPAGREALRLVGVNPGTREYLRAAVDYDDIGKGETDRFNLVLQRLRAPRTERIEEQQILRQVSINPGSARCVAELLANSGLMRVLGGLPSVRPDPTWGGSASEAGYVSSEADGTDGEPLTDYDVIGSVADRTGLWALELGDPFDLLCIPPLARNVDVGLATLHVAARFSHEHRALLVLDPPAHWTTAELALTAMRSWPFRSEDAVMFYPRLEVYDRLRGRPEIFGSAACAAGLLARQDATLPIWAPAEGQELVVGAGAIPVVAVEESHRLRLSRAGINTLFGARSRPRARTELCTLASDNATSSDWRHLSARRLANFIVASIERGLASAASGPRAREQAQGLVARFLSELQQEGAFAGSRPEDSYFVICDEQVNPREAAADGAVRLLFGIALVRPAQFHAWLVRSPGALGRARPVAVNRLATSPQTVDWEIETAILHSRGP